MKSHDKLDIANPKSHNEISNGRTTGFPGEQESSQKCMKIMREFREFERCPAIKSNYFNGIESMIYKIQVNKARFKRRSPHEPNLSNDIRQRRPPYYP